MNRTVKVHKDKETGEYYIKLRPLLYHTGVKFKDVDKYELTTLDNGFALKLFDKDGKQIKLERKNNAS